MSTDSWSEELKDFDYQNTLNTSKSYSSHYGSGNEPLLNPQQLELEREEPAKHNKLITPVFSVLVLVLIALNISLAAPTYYNDINWLPGTSQQYQTVLLLSSFVYHISSAIVSLVAPVILTSCITNIYCRLSVYCSGVVGSLVYLSCTFFRSTDTTYALLTLLTCGAIIYGLTSSMFIIQLKTDISLLAYEHSKLSQNPRELEGYLVAGFSLLHAAVLSAPLWRGVIYGVTLSSGINTDITAASNNVGCGTGFCEGLHIFADNTKGQSDTNSTVVNSASTNSLVQAVFGLFFTAALVAALIVGIYLPRINQRLPKTTQQQRCIQTEIHIVEDYGCCHKFNVFTFCSFAGHVTQTLLTPSYIAIGVNQTVLFHVFMEAYIRCTYSSSNRIIYFALLTVGGFAMLTGVVQSVLHRWNSRPKIMFLAWATQFSVLATLLFWDPEDDHGSLSAVLMLSAIGGAALCILQSQLSAFLGHVFSGDLEASFSHYQFWISISTASVVIAHSYSCAYVTVLMAVIVNSVAVLCYVSMEIYVRLSSRKNINIAEQCRNFMVVEPTTSPTWIPELDPHQQRHRSDLTKINK